MKQEKQKHVHFMGINGSGCANLAVLAHHAGYKVTGCDQSKDSYYGSELEQLQIPISVGHDVSHLDDDVDYVAVSPALFDINPDNPELLEAKRRGILMTWQEFMGKCLQKDKRVVAVSGTHGKTTTTFLAAEMLIEGEKDPTVLGGSSYKKWGSGGRPGSSDIFLCEADEFNRNFHHYKPEIAVLNNVEMDHPECYNNFEEVLESFEQFLLGDPKLKTVVFCGDSEGATEVVRRVAKNPDFSGKRVIAFVRNQAKDFSSIAYPVEQVIFSTNQKNSFGTTFTVTENHAKRTFLMKLYGEYNVSNAVCAIITSRLLNVDDAACERVLARFTGVGRRFDAVGSFMGVPVFDDYAHHPTEIASVLSMCKDYFPDKKVLAIFEPHQISRLRLMFQGYVDGLTIADHVIITKTHIGREIHKDVTPISQEEWKTASPKIDYEEEPERIAEMAAELVRNHECDMVLVIGAANSYKLSRFLCERA